jgi:hypothetical protein
MSAGDIDVILLRLEAMKRDHAEDMESLRGNLRELKESHSKCAERCWVGNDSQVRAAIMEEIRTEIRALIRSTRTDLAAIKDES